MMLEIPLTTKSSCTVTVLLGGIAQHDTFSWQIEDKHFVQLGKTNSDSQQVDITIKGVGGYSPDEEPSSISASSLAPFLMLVLAPLMTCLPYQGLNTLRHLFVQLNPHSRRKETMGRLTQLLIDTRYQAWKNR